jgi:hypothetical protein
MKNFIIDYAGTIGLSMAFAFIFLCLKAMGAINWPYWILLLPLLVAIIVVVRWEILKRDN